MKYFSLFSGIGGFELGIQRALPEAECVGYSEVDKYAEAIYRRHFPEHKPYGDATRIVPDTIPDFDLLVAGFPCQSFSVAGKRRGFQDTRGTLFFEIVRILRDKRPRYFLLENVKGLLSAQHGETFQAILGVLSDAGYLLQWEVLNSRNYGVPQNRDRVFIVGHLSGQPRPEVFPIGESNRKPEAKREEDGEIVNCIDSNYYKGPDGKRSLILHENMGGNISEHVEEACALCSGRSHNYQMVVTGVNRPSRGGEPRKDSLSCTVKAGESGSKNLIYCVDEGATNRRGKAWFKEETPTCGCEGRLYLSKKPLQTTKDVRAAKKSGSIRRLTPVECERLQGFPDNWTEYGAFVDNRILTVLPISDTQRYKVLGNAVTVNVIEFIMQEFDFGG